MIWVKLTKRYTRSKRRSLMLLHHSGQTNPQMTTCQYPVTNNNEKVAKVTYLTKRLKEVQLDIRRHLVLPREVQVGNSHKATLMMYLMIAYSV